MYFLLKNMEKGRPDFPSGTGLPDILVIRNYSVPSYVSLRSAQQVRRPTEQLWLFFNNFFCFFVEKVHIISGDRKGHFLSGRLFTVGCFCKKFVFSNMETDVCGILNLLAAKNVSGDLTLSIFRRNDLFRSYACEYLFSDIAEFL